MATEAFWGSVPVPGPSYPVQYDVVGGMFATALSTFHFSYFVEQWLPVVRPVQGVKDMNDYAVVDIGVLASGSNWIVGDAGPRLRGFPVYYGDIIVPDTIIPQV